MEHFGDIGHFDKMKDELLSHFDAVLGSDWAAERRVAVEAGISAGALLAQHFRHPQSIKQKVGRDFATAVDLEAESIIERTVAGRFPTHGFLGEEQGSHGQSEALWIVDPIDGTFNYTFGLPYFAVSIALAQNGEPVVAVVFDPYHGEFFYAQRGGGAWLNAERVRVSIRTRLDEAIVYQDFSHDAAEQMASLERMKRLMPHIRSFRVLGSAALGIAYVACGRLDAFFHHKLNAWDWAAAGLLVEEGGGIVSDMRGMPQSFAATTQDVVATNGHIHAALLHFLLERT